MKFNCPIKKTAGWPAVKCIQNLKNLFTAGILWVYEFSKILDTCAGGRQYFRNTVCGRPSWLSLFGPAFAFIKGCWVQPAALCQS